MYNIYTYMNSTAMNEQKGHAFEGEWKEVYGKVCREEMKGTHAIIKFQSQSKILNSNLL